MAGGVEMMSRVPMLATGQSAFVDPALRRPVPDADDGQRRRPDRHPVWVSQAGDAVALLSQQAQTMPAEQLLQLHRSHCQPGEGITVTEDECIRADATPNPAALPPAFAGSGQQGVDAFQLAGYPN